METKSSKRSVCRRSTRIGRWIPLAFYALIVLSWLVEGINFGLADRLWLVVFTLPAAIGYWARTRERHG